MQLTPTAVPTKIAKPFQLVISRGDDPENADGAIWRVGVRFLLTNDQNVICETPIVLGTPDASGYVSTGLPHKGEEINIIDLMTEAQRTKLTSILTEVETKLAAALGLTSSSGAIKQRKWQSPQ